LRLIARLERLASLVFIVALLGGCGGPLVKDSGDYSLPLNHVNRQQESPAADPNYRIQVGDTLDIKFFYNPELNEKDLPVRPDGYISLQLVDEVSVLGLTPKDLQDLLKKKYEVTELRDVEVVVIVRSFSRQRVFVDGEVGLPTSVPVMGQLTIMQAIAYARGLRDTARLREVILIRRGKDYKPEIRTVNLEKVLDGTDLGQDILLKAFDIVYVPKSPVCER
jgi:polysaccharide export outer membrane protein